MDAEIEKRWAGGELLVCALVQLILVNVAYRIDQNRSAPLISTSSWAIFMGIVVRSNAHSIGESYCRSIL